MHSSNGLTNTIGSLYFNGEYAISNHDWHQADSPWKAEQILAMMNRHSITPHSVCEIGCGAGEVLACLQRRLPAGTSFTGFEPAPEAFHISQGKTNDDLRFVQAAKPSNDEHFDLALLIDVIEHIEDYLGTLRDLRDIASRFIFHIPLDLSVLSILREWPLLRRRRRVGHLHYFTRQTALASLDDTGYTTVDHFYTEIEREAEWELGTFLLRRVPVRILTTLGYQEFAVRFFGDHSLLVLADSSFR